MNKLLIILFIFYNLFPSVYATKQIRDSLKIGDNYYGMHELVLNSYINTEKTREIIGHDRCSMSWRGYRAHWELIDGFLWLKDIQINPCSDKYQSLEASVLFTVKEYPIKADWFSGKVRFQISETKYVYMNGDKNDKLLGENYETLTFLFDKGELISKEIELVQMEY